MKIKNSAKRIGAIVTAALLAVCMLAICACDGKPSAPPATGTLESIEVTKQPNKTEYEVGDKFSRSGMRVTAHFVGGTSKTILGYKIDKDGPLTLDDTVITITYQDKSTTVNITVREKQIATHLSVESADYYTYKVEAEDCELGSEAAGTPKEDFFEYHSDSEGNPNTSGRISLGHLNHSKNTITMRVKSSVAADASLLASLSYNPSLVFDENIDTFWNDGKIETGWTVYKHDDAEYDWFDWNEYTLDSVPLKVGVNELVFKINALSVNFDYFKLAVSPIRSEAVSIAVTTPPVKTEYKDGERFDPTGMVVTATYENGVTAPINDYTYYTEPLRIGNTAVGIYFGELNTECPVTVIERDMTLESIRVDVAPYTRYNVGDYFHIDGMAVIATYSDGFEEYVLGFTADKTEPLTEADTKVTISYRNKSTELDITVEPADAHMQLNNGDTRTVRLEAENAVIAHHKDSDTHNLEEPPAGKTASGGVAVSGMRGSTTAVKFYIDSDVSTVCDLAFTIAHPWMPFNDQAALFVNGVRQETLPWMITSDNAGSWFEWKTFTIASCAIGTGRNTVEILNLGGNKGDGGFIFDCMDVIVNPLRSIAVTTAPAKTQYNVGEPFDPAGMVVSATYADGTVKAVADYTVTPDGALNIENEFVTVSYGGCTAQTPVTVTAAATLSSIRIDAQPTKKDYVAGEPFDPAGMVVTAIYSDGAETAVTQYTWDKEYFAVDDTSVTVSYEGKTASVTVTVTEPSTAHITVTEYGAAYTLELEDAQYTPGEDNSADRQSLVIADNDGCSGGKFLDSMDWRAGTAFDINIYSEIDVDSVWLYTAVATGAACALDDHWLVEWNYKTELTGIEVQGGWVPTEEKLSSNLGFKLHKGWNHIRITLKSSAGVNADFIKIYAWENQA